jgi:hypothetical protein
VGTWLLALFGGVELLAFTVAPTPHLDQLVNHVDSDPSGLFWG